MVSLSLRAEAVLERRDGLGLRQGKLTATDPSQVGQWEQLVRSAAFTGAGLGTGFGGAILLHRRRASRPLSVIVTPFHSSQLLTEEHRCALAFINDPAEQPPAVCLSLDAVRADAGRVSVG